MHKLPDKFHINGRILTLKPEISNERLGPSFCSCPSSGNTTTPHMCSPLNTWLVSGGEHVSPVPFTGGVGAMGAF